MSGKSPLSRGASTSKMTASDTLQSWLAHHRASAIQSIARLVRAPVSFLLTSLVIGIALALPAMLFVMIENLDRLAGRWDGAPRLTVYLDHNIPEARAIDFGKRLKIIEGVVGLEYISREAALTEFRQKSGLGDALAQLEDNPLPPVYVLAFAEMNPDQMRSAAATIDALAGVDFVQLDLEWVQKLQQIVLFARRSALLLGCLLSLGVLLTVSNTLRLEIQARREEVIVVKLVGGTDAFVRRPLLYAGLWYGVFGAFLSWVLVVAAVGFLSGPVSALAALYGSDYLLAGLGTQASLELGLAGALLGLAGAWLAVSQHLSRINPI